MTTTQSLMCGLSKSHCAGGIKSPMLLISCVDGHREFRILPFSINYRHTHTHLCTTLAWLCQLYSRKQTHAHASPYPKRWMTILWRVLRKRFISQLPLVDKAFVPTVLKAGGSNVTNYPPIPSQDRLVCLIYPQTG